MPYANKVDQRAYARKHYDENKALYKQRARVFTDLSRERLRKYIKDYLTKHPCLTCGEPDIVVLEFDHRVRTSKSFNIGDAVSFGYSIKRVSEEISKCDVLCANCHRRKTARERDLY